MECNFAQLTGEHFPLQQAHVMAENTQKAVRIVSTGRQGRNPLWVSVENEKSKSTESGTETQHFTLFKKFLKKSNCYTQN